MEGVNEFEQRVLAKLLAGDHPVLVALRAQAETARLSRREYTGVGFYCDFDVPSHAAPVTAPSDFHLSDVNATMEALKYGAGFVLFVRGGRLATLEGHTYEEPWPQEVQNLKLTYQHEPRELPFLL